MSKKSLPFKNPCIIGSDHLFNKECDQVATDRVICFCCGGGLKNWEPNDNPWYEHAKWFPLCEYVLKKQGMDHVKDITLKYPELNRPKLKNPCKANNVKIIHEILNDSRSKETKQKQ